MPTGIRIRDPCRRRATRDVSGPTAGSIRSTTILGVRRNGIVAMAGDGQVTVGDVVLKHGARKIRTLYDGAVHRRFCRSRR